MKKVNNLLISVFVFSILLGPFCLFLMEKTPVELPEWLTTEEASYLEGGIAQIASGDLLSIGGFANRSTQRFVEAAIENRIPCKARAMIANATIQQIAILESNVVFQWECCPTFYGSSTYYIPTSDALTYETVARNDADIENYQSFSQGVNEIALRHPDKKFVIYMVQAYKQQSVSPLYQYVPRSITPSEIAEALSESLTADNALFATDYYADLNEYYRDFYRTDHHWNIRGALRAFNTLAYVIGFDDLNEEGVKGVGQTSFSGALARTGLSTLQEEPFDLSNELDPLTILSPSGERWGFSRDGYYSAPPYIQYRQFHALYYNFLSENNTAIINDNCNGSALIIADSYKGEIQHLIAQRFGQVKLLNHLHNATSASFISEDTRLEQYLDDAIDTIIFIAYAQDYSTLIVKCPNYFQPTP